jgi:hypothetical protein
MWTETGIKRRYITDGDEYEIKFIPCHNFNPNHQLIIKKGEYGRNFTVDDDYNDELMIGKIRNTGTCKLFNAKLGEWIKLKVEYISLLIEVKTMTECEIKKYMLTEFINSGGYNNNQ